jgi:hypothetical protein
MTIAVEDPLELLPVTLELRALVTVLAGLNGVGKTRLLKQIQRSAGDPARLISLHELCAWLYRLIEDRPDLEEATEEVDPLEVDQEVTLDAVKSIVGRGYTEIRWYAIAFEESPFAPIVGEDVIPFFIVSDGETEYSLADMGLGELAAHVLLWTLWYVREKSELLLLLDEPDAYFPPRSREPLLDHIATIAATRQQAFVLTSHSREVIERALQHSDVLSYLGRVDGKVELTTAAEEVREIVQQVLYPRAHVELVAWVEDESAHALATALLARLDANTLDRLALYWAKGTGDLTEMRARLPRPATHPRQLEFAFIVDGDEGPSAARTNLWPVVALPGGMSPDKLFQRLAPLATGTLAALLGRTPRVIGAMLAKVEGLDPHDWTNDLAAQPGLDRSQVLKALAEACLDGDTEDLLVEEFRGQLAGSGLRAFSAL